MEKVEGRLKTGGRKSEGVQESKGKEHKKERDDGKEKQGKDGQGAADRWVIVADAVEGELGRGHD